MNKCDYCAAGYELNEQGTCKNAAAGHCSKAVDQMAVLTQKAIYKCMAKCEFCVQSRYSDQDKTVFCHAWAGEREKCCRTAIENMLKFAEYNKTKETDNEHKQTEA